ncbi:MAG: hypothetical protein EHM48_02580 [Planctomycetaceae bacterium]|nr:MAG: hypothetical protein EHM48_02580 [Planctomycetaceae bacterium]
MTNKDKRILIIAGGVLIAGLVAYLAVDGLLLSELRWCGTQQVNLANGINAEMTKKRANDKIVSQLNQMASRTLGDNQQIVIETIRKRLDDIAEKCGLEGQSKGSGRPNASPDWKPVAASPLPKNSPKDKDVQLGWAITARGRLDQVTDFLYMLENEPYLHRLENLKITPKDGKLDISVTFLTLALAPSSSGRSPATMPDNIPFADLKNRKPEYAAIVARDLLRPYVPKPAEVVRPPEVVVAPPPNNPTKPPPPPPVATFRLVGLPNWGDDQEVSLRNNLSSEMKYVKVGQKFAGAEIVMVDYRSLPRPDNKDVMSYGRLIQKIDSTYFSTELGQNVTDRREMKTTDLPSELQKPTTAPAGTTTAEAEK